MLRRAPAALLRRAQTATWWVHATPAAANKFTVAAAADSGSDGADDADAEAAAREYTSRSPMSDEQFAFMRDILSAPSPVGLEASMTRGVLEDRFNQLRATHDLDTWVMRTFKGNAGVVWESNPPSGDGADDDARLNVMVVGHADKIRMQVRSIGKDGKVWINTDSFLPLTLLGNQVRIFSSSAPPHGGADDAAAGDKLTTIDATAEAVGAIHFAPAGLRNGKAGLKENEIYLELGLHGTDRQKQAEALGIRVGDPVLLNRPITRCAAPHTFSGAYLDNGLGCFVAAEVARLVAERRPELAKRVNCQFAFAAHEEIGRFGSRICAAECRPDVLIAVDVNHDYEAAPRVGSERYQPLTMGLGMTLCVGAVASEQLNGIIEGAAAKRGIPVQRDVRGRDTGTDAMAGVLGNVDCAVTSVGFPIRNMHTISELGHTGDILACIEALYGTIEDMADTGLNRNDLCEGHPRLDHAVPGVNL